MNDLIKLIKNSFLNITENTIIRNIRVIRKDITNSHNC